MRPNSGPRYVPQALRGTRHYLVFRLLQLSHETPSSVYDLVCPRFAVLGSGAGFGSYHQCRNSFTLVPAPQDWAKLRWGPATYCAIASTKARRTERKDGQSNPNQPLSYARTEY